MIVIDTAVDFMVAIANDSSHGYDQANRWGPNYDCSSLVITAYQTAGTGVKTAGATYTGNMYNVFLRCGFKDVTSSVTLSTGNGLKKGDVLLNKTHHTAMMIDGSHLVQASINEKGGVTGGQSGDQTGGEIHIRNYYNYPWNFVLRYVGTASPGSTTPSNGKYTVQADDSLWELAEKFLGNGNLYPQIMAANNLTTTFVFNADRCARTVGSGEERWRYFPRVDVSITAVDGVMQGKQATLETLERLSGSSVTAENWKLFAAQLDLLNLPGRQEIIEDWSRRFAEAAPPAEAAERGETEEIHDI